MNPNLPKTPRIGAICVICFLLSGFTAEAAAVSNAPFQGSVTQSDRDGGIQVANLKEQLTFGLRARLPREHAFIASVVEKVEAGDLPLELVLGTFHWARQKRPYPFPYFEFALRLRAARYGIIL